MGAQADSTPRPSLSICIPTKDRPSLLLRTLDSVLSQDRREIEVLVCDNSENDHSTSLCERMLDPGSDRHRYVLNRPGLGLVGNHNRCVQLARGEWVLILHDDDYLLPGAVSTMCDAARTAAPARMAMLFGVNVVNAEGKVLKRQTFKRETHLPPREAMRRLMSNSSFVRPPAMLVRRQAYEVLGSFVPEMLGTNDIDMWSRLFSAYGVTCVPTFTVAYTVHAGALTTAVFEPGTLARIDAIFRRVAGEGLVSETDARRWQRRFVHQFILAGTYRHIRERDRAGARKVMELFALPSIRELGISLRWVPIRTAFALLTLGAQSEPS